MTYIPYTGAYANAYAKIFFAVILKISMTKYFLQWKLLIIFMIYLVIYFFAMEAFYHFYDLSCDIKNYLMVTPFIFPLMVMYCSSVFTSKKGVMYTISPC